MLEEGTGGKCDGEINIYTFSQETIVICVGYMCNCQLTLTKNKEREQLNGKHGFVNF